MEARARLRSGRGPLRLPPRRPHLRGGRSPLRLLPLLPALLLLPFAGAGTAAAQAPTPSLGTGVQYQSFTFDEGLGTSAARLLLVPLGVRLPVGERFSVDLFGSWALGEVEREGTVYRLDGPVDTQLRAQLAAAPWAIVSLAVNLPTGNATHDFGEAVVASVLATNMLGFREANWGTGLGVTTGLSTARRVGSWGLGAGLSHRVAGEFEPSAGQSVSYAPGHETRVRIGADRNVGASGKITAGLTFQRFTADQLDGRNLFQAGNRIRGDLAWAFRAGATTWTLHGANLWRERGDVTLPQLDGTGTVVGDTTFTTGTQNLVVVGADGSIPIGTRRTLRPSVDLRVQSREEGAGSGWVAAVGGDLALRVFGSQDIFPSGRFLVGSMEGTDGEQHSVRGFEAGLTLRLRR